MVSGGLSQSEGGPQRDGQDEHGCYGEECEGEQRAAPPRNIREAGCHKDEEDERRGLEESQDAECAPAPEVDGPGSRTS